MSDTQARFEAAVTRSKSLPSQPPKVQLKLYGLFKQATTGDVIGKRPGPLDIKGRAKHDAWAELEGTSAEDAMASYADFVDELAGGR